MKQHISVEQLQELSPEQRERVRELWKPEEGDWFTAIDTSIEFVIDIDNGKYLYDGRDWHPKRNCLPLLNVGQCIELCEPMEIIHHNGGWGIDGGNLYPELIDALWAAVKAML